MKKSLLLWITLLAIIGSMLTACSGASSISLAGDWTLISYGSSSNPTPAVPNTGASLTFGTDGTIGGNMGCNSFGGDYKVDGETITFGQVASTLMACDEQIMQQESAVFNMFANTATFKVEGSTLTLISADGNSVVLLSRK